MSKDTIFAIAIGFAVGLIVAFSIVNLPTILKKSVHFQFQLPKLSFPKSKTSISPTPTTSSLTKLEILSPKDNTIVYDSKLTLTGKASSDSLLIIDTNNEDKLATPSSDGSFKVDLKLNEGTNFIVVSAYKNENETDSKTITVSFTTEKL